MYALKARDKLHKQEKKAYEERHSPNPKVKKNDKSKKQPSRPGPVTANREAKYVGSFSISMDGGWKSDFAKTVKQQLSRVNTKDSSHAMMFVSVRINMEGIKVLSPDGRETIMAHSLKRILFCTADSKKHLFAIVARNPQEGTEGVYTHVFMTEKKDQANELNQIVSKAFKVHFASKTIGRQRKEIVKRSPQSSRSHRSPSPQPQSSQPQSPPPYNPDVVGAGGFQPVAQTRGERATGAGSQPWTTAQGGHAVQGSHLSPHPAFAPQKTKRELMQESGVLELEMATIQARLQEIQQQMRELAGIEDAMVQLTMQMSRTQQQLEEKQRQHAAVQFQIQDLTLQEQQPAAAAAYPPPYHGVSNGSAPLPDFSRLSLEEADWYHEGIPRDIAMEILSHQPDGAFMVRQSSSSPGSYAITLKATNNKILNYLIENVHGNVRLQGSQLIFPSIVELVYSYSVNRDILPCALTLSTANPAFLQGDGGQGGSDSEEDDDYRTAAHYRLIS